MTALAILARCSGCALEQAAVAVSCYRYSLAAHLVAALVVVGDGNVSCRTVGVGKAHPRNVAVQSVESGGSIQFGSRLSRHTGVKGSHEVVWPELDHLSGHAVAASTRNFGPVGLAVGETAQSRLAQGLAGVTRNLKL